MRLAAFHFHFKLQNQAGSSRMRNLATKLIDRGHDLTIYTGASCRDGMLDNNEIRILKKNFLFHKALYKNKIKIISFPCFYNQKHSLLHRILSFIKFNILACAVPLFIEKKSDVYFASSTPLTISLPAIFISKIYKKPFVFEVRDLWPDAVIQMGLVKNKILIFLAKLLENFTYKNASLIITLTKGVKRVLENRCDIEIKYIPIGVDNIYFDNNSKYTIKNNKKFEITYAGACGYNNAIEVIFKVAEIVNTSKFNNFIHFNIVGEGPALMSLSKKITPNMSLHGKLPKPEVAEILKKSDLALFSQRKVVGGNFKKDVVGNKYFDFLGAGLPIVIGSVRDGEMAQEIQNNKCGIVTEPEDCEAIFESICKIFKNKEMQKSMSIASLELAAKYNQEKITSSFCDEMEKVFYSSC